MKIKLCVLIFALTAALASAQTTNLTTLLQQGLFEEQASRNLPAAISNYQALAAQFDQDRQLAATAVFRIGECYRMEGRTNEAAAQYQRILRDFSDQTTLATLSRQNLTGMGVTSPTMIAAESPGVEVKNENHRLWVALSRDEIEEDVFSMSVNKPSRRPRKRAKTLQKHLDVNVGRIASPQKVSPT